MSAAWVKTTAKPGRFCDGGASGLYLTVRDRDHKFWCFRYRMAGKKLREAGLGPAAGPSTVPLAKAREKARELHVMVREGRDPLDERARRKVLPAAKTFADVATMYIDAHQATWKNAKHAQQWSNTLRDYVLPIIGALPVADVKTGHVMEIVGPIWRTKPETAGRVRGRIETVLNYAKAHEWRSGENPARWSDHIANLLPARAQVARVKHHAALPWRQVGTFMERLSTSKGMSALALRFMILTAARSGEVRGARWNEVDLPAGIWTVPGARMKARVEHRVPLSKQALAVLRDLEPLRKSPTDLIFLGGRVGAPLSDVAVSKCAHVAAGTSGITAHGFRSTFRDWVAEATNHPRELAERALAHTLTDKTEAAYQRGDLFEKRAKLMEAWASFCDRPSAPSANVIDFREATA